MSTTRIAPRITISGIPELGEYSSAGVTHILSFLGPNSPAPPFATFAPHRRLTLRFHDVIEPQPDQIAPTREDVERLLHFGREVSETPDDVSRPRSTGHPLSAWTKVREAVFELHTASAQDLAMLGVASRQLRQALG